jgi:hypothetical protein
MSSENAIRERSRSRERINHNDKQNDRNRKERKNIKYSAMSVEYAYRDIYGEPDSFDRFSKVWVSKVYEYDGEEIEQTYCIPNKYRTTSIGGRCRALTKKKTQCKCNSRVGWSTCKKHMYCMPDPSQLKEKNHQNN